MNSQAAIDWFVGSAYRYDSMRQKIASATLNGEPCILTLVFDRVFAVTAFATDGERIHRAYRGLNPDKLAFVGVPPLGAVGRVARLEPPSGAGDH